MSATEVALELAAVRTLAGYRGALLMGTAIVWRDEQDRPSSASAFHAAELHRLQLDELRGRARSLLEGEAE